MPHQKVWNTHSLTQPPNSGVPARYSASSCPHCPEHAHTPCASLTTHHSAAPAWLCRPGGRPRRRSFFFAFVRVVTWPGHYSKARRARRALAPAFARPRPASARRAGWAGDFARAAADGLELLGRASSAEVGARRAPASKRGGDPGGSWGRGESFLRRYWGALGAVVANQRNDPCSAV